MQPKTTSLKLIGPQILKFVLLLTISLGLSTCERESVEEVVLFSGERNHYFLELKLRAVSLWNVHLGCGRREFLSEHRFNFDTLSATVYAKDLNMTYLAQGSASDMTYRGFRGEIHFSSDSVLIKLQQPYYKDGVNIDHWEGYEHNGWYKLRIDTLR